MIARARLVILAGALAGLALGCGYTEQHEVTLHPPSSPTRDVDVYMAGQPLPRPFYEIAMLQVIGYGSQGNMEDMVHALSTRARALGCDALAHVTFDQGYTSAHSFGVCVKYVAGAPFPQAPGVAAPIPPPVPSGTPVPTAPPAPDARSL